MDNIKLREVIRKVIRELLDEITTTSAVPGYLTPNAFAGSKGNLKKVKDTASRLGYTLTDKGKESTKADPLREHLSQVKTHYKMLVENYYSYKNDTSKQPHQKIGTAIAELSRQIKLIERAIKMNSRLQKESGVTSNKLWKRTQHQLTRLEGKCMELAGKLREMRG